MGLFSKKKEKVIGNIIAFEVKNGEHYPCFSYRTKEGKLIEKTDMEVSLEEAVTDEYLAELLGSSFPIEDVSITYRIEDPYDFTGAFL